VHKVCAIVTTLDNLENLQETMDVLENEPLSEIVIVDNGSQDGTSEWLAEQFTKEGLAHGISTAESKTGPVAILHSCTTKGTPVTIVHRANCGAGPGRNSGLDAASPADFYMMLDGGIRPLRGGTEKMLDYLSRHPDIDVIGVHIQDFETDKDRAWRRWPYPITDDRCYKNTRLSHTAYCMSRSRAWDGLRFCEEGPFGQPGWGADDDEMMYRWNRAGIKVDVIRCACNIEGPDGNPLPCTGVHPYRRASGSFRRLFKDSGIWPNQYGSVYEQRVVWLNQNDCDQQTLDQWGEPWITVVVKASYPEGAKAIKRAHERLRRRRFGEGWEFKWNPYSIMAWMPEQDDEFWKWAEPRMLRQHHGDAIILPSGAVIRRDKHNEHIWTGDFRLSTNAQWRKDIRPGAFYYALVETRDDVDDLIDYYDKIHPPQPTRLNTPKFKRELERQEWTQET